MSGPRGNVSDSVSFIFPVTSKTKSHIYDILFLGLLGSTFTLWSLKWFFFITIIGSVPWMYILKIIHHCITCGMLNPAFLTHEPLGQLHIPFILFLFCIKYLVLILSGALCVTSWLHTYFHILEHYIYLSPQTDNPSEKIHVIISTYLNIGNIMVSFYPFYITVRNILSKWLSVITKWTATAIKFLKWSFGKYVRHSYCG